MMKFKANNLLNNTREEMEALWTEEEEAVMQAKFRML
jgi:hypothetical protein